MYKRQKVYMTFLLFVFSIEFSVEIREILIFTPGPSGVPWDPLGPRGAPLGVRIIWSDGNWKHLAKSAQPVGPFHPP